jgi:GT2 family glycosyltransferase
LYHWRAHKNSTSSTIKAKPYAILAGQKALEEHFLRTGIGARVDINDFGYRVRYDLPKTPPLVSLIIPTRNGFEILKACIDSILNKTSYKNYEILVIDNGSDDQECLNYFNEISNNATIRVISYPGEFNYSAINNFAVSHAKGEIIGLINNDIEVISSEWLNEMVSIAVQPNVGAVGAKLYYSNGTLQHGGVILGLGGVAGHSNKYAAKNDPGYCGRSMLIQSLSAVTAACLVIKKSLFLLVGGLDANNLKVAFNDVDFCLRIRHAGYRNVWTPHAELYHHESITRGAEDSLEKQARFTREVDYMKDRWGSDLLSDPAYNPNLTLDYEDFSFSWPPRI